MNGYFIKKNKAIGGKTSGKPRIWLEGPEVSKAGLAPGDSYSVSVKGGSIHLRADPNGNRTVTAKPLPSNKITPVIDLSSKELLSLFEGMDAIRLIQKDGEVVISPLASEVRKKERRNSLKWKIDNNIPLKMGSISHGGGVLDHAIHKGVESTGIAVEMAFANEIRPELVAHSMRNNPVWSPDSIPLVAPMQELAFDEDAMAALPRVDILVGGLPCSGASVAGRAKRGTSMAEEHPEVGHLVVAALMIIGRVNPAFFILENVVPYSSSASAAILRNQLRDLGYTTHETTLRGSQFNAPEDRVRWCMVAATEGVNFSWDMIRFPEKQTITLSDYLDPFDPNDPAWSEMRGLKAKQVRDAAAGKGFRMQILTGDSSAVPTIGKGYAKIRSTEPKLQHPENPDLLRQFSPAEHARFKQIPEGLIEGMSATMAHELLGQSINHDNFVEAGRIAGQSAIDFAAGSEMVTLSDLSESIAQEMIDTAVRVVSEIRKPVRGVTYEGPISAVDLGVGMIIQDVGNSVGIIYKTNEVVSPEGRIPAVGDEISVTLNTGKERTVVWLNEPTPAVTADLEKRLHELGYPPIGSVEAPKVLVEPEEEIELGRPEYDFGF
jgi:DNA (cytosine-5)-methyltransferase 1